MDFRQLCGIIKVRFVDKPLRFIALVDNPSISAQRWPWSKSTIGNTVTLSYSNKCDSCLEA